MKFGKVAHPELIDFRLPEDSFYPKSILDNAFARQKLQINVGCAK